MAKAISLWQPYALLCLLKDTQGNALKEFETRSWATNYRGTLIIHAAKRWTRQEQWQLADFFRRFPELTMFPELTQTLDTRYLGAAIGTVELVDCHKMYAKGYLKDSRILSGRELAFGYWQQGRWAWEFANPRLFPEPIPYRGQQGMWEWDMPLPVLS